MTVLAVKVRDQDCAQDFRNRNKYWVASNFGSPHLATAILKEVVASNPVFFLFGPEPGADNPWVRYNCLPSKMV